LPEWLDDQDEGDTFIHEVGENAVVSALNSTFKMAPAAGGIVVVDGQFVSIVRHGIPDLPKGHIEKGESPETAALREVEEETGLKNLRLGELICVTHHTYRVFGEDCLKHTWWFRMYDDAEESLVPQEEEDITAARWVKKECLPEYLEGTYPSIREVFISAGLL
jgi:8-oxo-dGTP pyrophosphatase MutT (NUDIX family)